MQNLCPGVIRHHLGDAEFTFLKTGREQVCTGTYEPGEIHCHRYFEVHCNFGESCEIRLATGKVRLETDHMLLICPGGLHHAVKCADSYRILSFELRQVKGDAGFYRYFYGLLNTLHLKPLPVNHRFRADLMNYAAETMGNTVMSFCRMKLLSLQMLTAFLENLTAFAGVCGDAPYIPEHFEAFDAMLDMMIYGESTLQEIANHLGYSPRHTARLIRYRYGASLCQIRKQMAEIENIHEEIIK